MIRALLVFICMGLLTAGRVGAQDATETPESSHGDQVFVTRDASGPQDQLIFIGLVDGAQTSLLVDGERYTPVRDAVLFFDRASGRVRLAHADGVVQDHPFVQLAAGAKRVDWALSADHRLIAWTVTFGDTHSLTTLTSVADLDGSNIRQVLQDGPRDGIRALPVAFSSDGDMLYMDYQPDTLGDLIPFRQYAGLFSVDLTASQVAPLPDEPGCFCGGGIGFDHFVRLALSADLSGFDVRIRDLNSSATRTAPALRLPGYTQGGDVLISPDGTLAIYALAKVSGLGTAQQSAQTVFVLVDLDAGTQKALTEPITTFIRPVAWTEDNQAVLFISPAVNGTWKVDLSDGKLNKVSNATYVGLIS
jgi:hypothetical protein